MESHKIAIEDAQLLISPLLHAKYYRIDERCLVGSANITGSALGWVNAPRTNLELMVEVPSNFEGILAWESNLIDSSMPATAELRDSIAAAAKKIENTDHSKIGMDSADIDSSVSWLPACPTPDRLWSVYIGKGQDDMSIEARQAAKDDLAIPRTPHLN